MNLKNKKSILLFISFSLLGAFVLYLAGCSGKSDFTLWGKFEGSNEDSNLAEFFSTIRPRPGNPDSHYLLAGYYQQRGQHREAIAEFKKVISIDPSYVKAYNGLGVSYDLLGQFGNALLSYETAISLDSSQAYLYNNLGYSWLMQENPDRAISAFGKAISLQPEELRFHNNLACAYAEKSQFQLAMEEFLRGGDEAQAHFNMAEVYFQKGIYAKAGKNYTAALQLNPSKTLARTGAKAAETLASILGKTHKISASQAGTVTPESPKVEEKKAEKENSVTVEYSRPVESQVAQTTVSAASVLNKPEIPVISLASLKMGKEDKRDSEPVKVPGVTSTYMVDSNAGINGNGMEEWNYEMKMALLQGKAVPIERGVPKNAEKTLVAKKKKDIRQKVGIEVSNGNGVNQMAKRVGIYLQKKGYQVDRLTNSKPFNHGQTRIYYQEGNWESALGVADQLPIYYDLIELKRLDRLSIQVKIVLGKDMIPYDKKFREKEGS